MPSMQCNVMVPSEMSVDEAEEQYCRTCDVYTEGADSAYAYIDDDDYV